MHRPARKLTMLIVTTEEISGKNLEMLGLVKGSTVQTVNAFKDIGASFKNAGCSRDHGIRNGG